MHLCLSSHLQLLLQSRCLREQKYLEITAPHLLNSRGATTKVPMTKTSSGRTVYSNTSYSQPDKKSPSSHALATDNNASPFVSYLNQKYHGMALALDIANHQTPLPTTLSKVLVSSAKTEWLAAMKHEFDAIVLNGTFELCPLPSGRKGISTSWVLKIQHDGSCKARWVERGFSRPEILFATIYLTHFLRGYDHTHFNAVVLTTTRRPTVLIGEFLEKSLAIIKLTHEGLPPPPRAPRATHLQPCLSWWTGKQRF